jgi:hypothetical protein
MSKGVASTIVLLAALMFSPLVALAQTDGWGRPVPAPAKNPKAAPAPRRDISGIWDPGNRGIQAMGASANPEDGKPEHQLSYTPAGLAKLNTTMPSNGSRTVLPQESNDPAWHCDPQGMPREDLFELRQTQIVQMPEKILILYEYGRVWRTIWTDGRDFPKNPEPRWFGYSIGKWEDDNTLVVDTIGMDEKTWIDRAGRPHSDVLHVEERFHRVDQDTLELSVKIDDPKMYTKPWMAVDKLPFYSRPATFDVREMMCSPTELAEYNKFIGDPELPANSKKK